MSKRIFIHKRAEMKDKALLIVNFDGVVGYFARLSIADVGPSKLYFRAGGFSFLKAMAQIF